MRDSERPAPGSVPEKGTMVFRGEHHPLHSVPQPTVGIHWTTHPGVTASFDGRQEARNETFAVELTDPAKQVIPYGALRSAYYDTDKGKPESGNYSRMQGFAGEKEIRLRPGATFQANGREVTVDNTKGAIAYPNLHEYATTPEAATKEWFHATNELGHIQGAMFDSVHEGRRDPTTKGYVTNMDLLEGDFDTRMDNYVSDVTKFGHHPDAPEWPTHEGRSMDQYVKPLKHQPKAEPEPEPVHHRVANQMQFEGF